MIHPTKIVPKGKKSIRPPRYWDNKTNQRKFMDELGQKLNIKQLEDWNVVTHAQIIKHGGSGLVNKYNGSPLKLLQSVYPEYPWSPQDRQQLPPGYWYDISNQRRFMDELSKKLNIKQLEDWNDVTAQQIMHHGGGSLLQKYNGSPLKLLQNVYPDQQWNGKYHHRFPSGYWGDISNQRKFMDELSKKLNITQLNDWNAVTHAQIVQHGGLSLINKYDKSPVKLLQHVYPEHKWIVKYRQKRPPGYWDDISNQRKFMDELSKKLNIKKLEDWDRLTQTQIIQFGGSGILNKYNGSPLKLLQHIYPEHNWSSNDRQHSIQYWDDISNQRQFMDELAKKLNIKQLEDWNGIISRQIIQHGGGSLLRKYCSSPLKLLQSIYPEHNWTATSRARKPRGYWEDPINQRHYLQHLSKQLGVTSKEDWLLVAKNEVHHSLLKRYSSLSSALRNVLDIKVTVPQSSTYISQPQRVLFRKLRQLFPDYDVQLNAKCNEFQYDQTNRPFEADILIPSLSLAFEYQGGYHYHPVYYSEKSLEAIQQRDQAKNNVLLRLGFTLISVPYWWDRSNESLVGTITKLRPDLQGLSTTLSSINYADSQITPKNQFMISRHFKSEDPTGWWMSEKYDGIRGYWDGSQMISRGAKNLVLPKHIIDTFPKDTMLDGEIWFGPGSLTESMKVALRSKHVPWEKFQFMVFDAPKHGGQFEERIEYLKATISAQHPYIKVVPHIQCSSRNHLEKFLHQTLKASGEGVILRAPKSHYIEDRSSLFLKYKPYLDEEVLVLEQGDSANYMLRDVATWNCVMRNNVKFQCPATASISSEIRNGMIVTIKHSGFFMDGKPRRPRISSIRPDVTKEQFWNDR